MKNILVFGATSSLGIAICRQIANQASSLILVGRNQEELEILAHDLNIRFAIKTDLIVQDFSSHKFSYDFLYKKKYDEVFMLVGDMGNKDQDDIQNIEEVIKVNFLMPAKILTLICQIMVQNKRGKIALISSVAGDRGRQSNYPYGSAKAAISTFASGLRNRFSNLGIHIMDVKLGFTDTPMTYEINSPLIASREYVAKEIIKALNCNKNIIYVPFFWRYIMLIIKNIPEAIFKKMKL